MVSNFVPGSGNPLGIDPFEWEKVLPIDRLEMVLDIIGKSTFDYLELGIPWINGEDFQLPFDSVAGIIRSHNLAVGSFCSLIPGRLKTVGEVVQWDSLTQYINNVFLNCNKLGGNIIVYGSGASRMIPKKYPKDSAERDVIKFLKLMSDIIDEKKYPFKIVIEPLNTKECNFINSLSEAYKLALRVGSPNIGILIDTYHAYRQKTNFLDELSDVIDKVMHIHIAQPEDRGWPGHLYKENTFDFTQFFKIINQFSYNGNITVECNFNDLKKEIQPCKNFLNSVCFV